MFEAISSAYIHLPFCLQKCLYCDFVSYEQRLEDKPPYLKALEKEIKLTYKFIKEKTESSRGVVALKTLYLGGGTPSVFRAEELSPILSALKSTFSFEKGAEITLEVNPETVSYQELIDYKKIGINRLSIGIQSLQDNLLKTLGRIHTAQRALETIDKAQAAGFDNISCDIMTGLPGQTIQDVDQTLELLLAKNVPHLSFYALSLEEGTPFMNRYGQKEEELPSPELERLMYHHLITRLVDAGYLHYEISNCARPGYESLHNINYWRARGYYGFGAGAHSFYENKRRGNIGSLDKYLELLALEESDLGAIWEEETFIDLAERQKEFMLLGLRLIKGVEEKRFKDLFGVPLQTVFADEITTLMAKDLLEKTNKGFRLTRKGLDFGNEVFRLFV